MPAQVSGFGPGSGVVAITVGRRHACAIKSDQSLLCWSDNPLGALGDGYTCAARNNGAAMCRGTNGSGQLGNGSRTASLVPVCAPLSLGVREGAGVDAIAVGGGHSCARKNTGAAVCRGGNANGQLGNGTRDLAVAPQPVAFGDSIFRDGLE